MFRHDIPEGAEEHQLPARFGFGSIQSLPELGETYVTVRAFGWRLFIARGIYTYGSDRVWPVVVHRRTTRWWLKRPVVVPEVSTTELQSRRQGFRAVTTPATQWLGEEFK